ncbi:MAG: GGDEF domain-containing protein [Candidatus Hydrogenedentota bacterium]
MDEIEKWKQAVEDLQHRLTEETRTRKELEDRCKLLEKLVYRDPSTGLRTETYLRSRVHEEIERSIRYPAAATLITVCAPQNKADVLPTVGRRLSDELRGSDHVFSLSQSGLAVLLVETPGDAAQRVIERISSDLEQLIGGYGYTVTSFPRDTNLPDEFLNLAMERHNEVARKVQPNGGSNGDNGGSRRS